MDITFNALLTAASGSKDGRTPNASCLIKTTMVQLTDGTENELQSVPIVHPIINVFRQIDHTTIDLVFASRYDAELSMLWHMLENFGVAANSLNEDTGTAPLIRLFVMPSEYDGRCFLQAVNPLLWTLQPKDVGGETCVVRMVFADDNVDAFETEE